MLKIAFAEPKLPASGIYAVAASADRTLSPEAIELDKKLGGSLRRAMNASRFTGKRDETLSVPAPLGAGLTRVVLYGVGKAEELSDLRLQGIGAAIVAHLNANGDGEAAISVGRLGGATGTAAQRAVEFAFGAVLRAYRFDKYKTREKPEKKPTLKKVTVMVTGASAAQRSFMTREKVAEGVFLTRDVVSEPPNVIYPTALAEQAKGLAKLGVEVEVLGVREMKKLGMGALLGVGQGSVHEPAVVTMNWHGDPKGRDRKPIAFCGKGVTFDTGGISLKPAAGMEDMKWDMAGAGTVIGLMKALAGRRARVNAVGVVGLVENMPSGLAQRPSDIVVSMSGQTVEVLNTDAEGRLVLADVLWYCQDRFKPRFMVDLATLTGAIVIALGHEHAGMFTNNDELAEKLLAAGAATGESLWRMPLGDAYDQEIDSDAADIKNIGAGRAGGSIIGAQFLQRFVNNVPWAHLDIAGMAWSKKDQGAVPKGATAFGLRLLDRLVADNYESS
jgi:leucyl aminopeptidase